MGIPDWTFACTALELSRLLVAALFCFVLPAWLLAGLLDWYFHRKLDIQHTSGTRESLLHILLISEGGSAVLAGMLLEINALVLAYMIACYVAHEITVWIDLRYSWPRRPIPPLEQMAHSLQEVLPLTGLLIVVTLNWDQFLALLQLSESARWQLAWKLEPLPWQAVAAIVVASLLFAVFPFFEELWRCLRADGRTGVRRERP
ncbi:MAG: diguanylate cyclase [Paucimonas sp.]|nr:diguanylate cyclase [Paucimonas sp.]